MVYSDSGEAVGHKRDLGPKGGDLMNRIAFVGVALVLLVVGCSSSDPTASDEYAALEQELVQTNQELAQAETQLAEVTAERDALASLEHQPSGRHDKAVATLDGIVAILDDPAAFGAEEDVVDLIATHATADALMDDDVFGPANYRSGFYNTLYGGAIDAQIDVYHAWVSDDGGSGGALWVWHGTNAAGNPFELPGLSVITFNDDGIVSYEFVTYPYSDEYVRQAVTGAGT
jgi:hypothetical protein